MIDCIEVEPIQISDSLSVETQWKFRVKTEAYYTERGTRVYRSVSSIKTYDTEAKAVEAAEKVLEALKEYE